ncbi:MAG: RagB/SusD family nutrient uptake outer membrane protein [Bacteroidales bacterium]|nr:RagB/SusD family nutrient uptake outer membrane protein [Bacteroidales bacterium]
MKKLIILFALIPLVFTSCGDMTLMPEDKVSPDGYFRNESDLLLWCNSFYSDILESSLFGTTTDLFLNKSISAYVQGTRNPSTQSWSYTALRKVNYMLERLDQCPDKAVARKYEAVGRFFRAYFYFKLVRVYGDVPWYDHVLGSEDPDVYKARDPREYVMTKVLEDFDFAIANLPTKWEAMNTRVTKWAALGMASRAALYEGTFRKYHKIDGSEKYLRACAEYGREFINSAPFSLNNTGATPYRDLFIADDAMTQEVVLARHYDTQYGVFHSNGNSIETSFASATRRFANHFLMKDGTRFTDKEGWETMGYLQETSNRDPRLAQILLCPGYVQRGSASVTPNTFQTITGYQIIKHHPSANKCQTSSDDTDIILLRAPEVYLNFAEALAELGEITQGDLDVSINKIRARAGIPALKLTDANANPDPYLYKCYPNVTTGTYMGVILEIRRERTIELAFEMPDRSWDMFRWAECKQCLQHYVPWHGVYIPALGSYDTTGDGKANVTFYKDGAFVKLKVGNAVQDVSLSEGDYGYIVGYPDSDHGSDWDDSRDYLWPIPAGQRTLNPNLTQNPGWVDGVN